MSQFNRIILIGRLTREPDVRTFANGGKAASFGFVVNARKKNQQTQQWEDEPMFIDVQVFNRGEHGTLANIVEQYCRKGSMVCLEGKLVLEQWDDKATGQKRSKHKIIADNIQLLDKKPEGEEATPRRPAPAQQQTSTRHPQKQAESFEDPAEIPFSFVAWIGLAVSCLSLMA